MEHPVGRARLYVRFRDIDPVAIWRRRRGNYRRPRVGVDPVVFSVTVLVLLFAGLAASIVPALRAASVDPLVALRPNSPTA